MGHRRRLSLLSLLASAIPAAAQQPVISPNGVVNAASYLSPPAIGSALQVQSLATIQGQNLAPGVFTAAPPYPKTLGGTTVTFDGVPAPLFYVSPTQINLQVPSSLPSDLFSTGLTTEIAQVPVVVQTASGASDPQSVGVTFVGPGTFTLDGSGCGQGAILNVKADGSVSVNSPQNSASPGDALEIFATGLGSPNVYVADGYPAPSQPTPGYTDPWYNNRISYGSPVTIGRQGGTGTIYDWYWGSITAPGLVSVDQVNTPVPDIEGCAVPLQTLGGPLASQAVLVSIHNGGGACVDPPPQSFGQIAAQRTVFLNSSQPETDVVTASFESAPWLQKPSSYPPQIYPPYSWSTLTLTNPPPQQQPCPIPGDTFPDIGAVAVQPQGSGPVQATTDSSGGQLLYTATLPSGTLQGGSLQITAAGSGSIGPFQTTLSLGSPIQITSSFPAGTAVNLLAPFPITWTGGDSTEVVIVTLVKKTGELQDQSVTTSTLASTQSVVWQPELTPPIGCCGTPNVPVSPFSFPGHELQIIIDVAPASGVGSFSAPGLTLGGTQTWGYEYRFTGLTEQGN